MQLVQRRRSEMVARSPPVSLAAQATQRMSAHPRSPPSRPLQAVSRRPGSAWAEPERPRVTAREREQERDREAERMGGGKGGREEGG